MSIVCWGRGDLVYMVLSLRINVYTDWFSERNAKMVAEGTPGTLC